MKLTCGSAKYWRDPKEGVRLIAGSFRDLEATLALPKTALSSKTAGRYERQESATCST
jgi:hypothetical protein